MLADLAIGEVIGRSAVLGGVAECAGKEKGIVEVVEAGVAGAYVFYESEAGLAFDASGGSVACLAVGHAADAARCPSIVILAQCYNTSCDCDARSH